MTDVSVNPDEADDNGEDVTDAGSVNETTNNATETYDTVDVHAADAQQRGKSSSAAASSTAAGTSKWLRYGVPIILAVFAVGFVYMFGVVRNNNDSVAALSEQVDDLAVIVDALSGQIELLGSSVDAQQAAIDAQTQQITLLQSSVNALQVAGGAAPSTPLPDGVLPPFNPDNPTDPAIGMMAPVVTGEDYYTGEEINVDYTTEKAQVLLTWAHWCPYCQQELPDISAWWGEHSEEYPYVELTTISSAQDSERGNPEKEYLDENQFQLSMIIDQDNAIADDLGLTSFPYWVVVAPDGTVLLRHSGLVGSGSYPSLFGDINQLAEDAAMSSSNN